MWWFVGFVQFFGIVCMVFEEVVDFLFGGGVYCSICFKVIFKVSYGLLLVVC